MCACARSKTVRVSATGNGKQFWSGFISIVVLANELLFQHWAQPNYMFIISIWKLPFILPWFKSFIFALTTYKTHGCCFILRGRYFVMRFIRFDFYFAYAFFSFISDGTLRIRIGTHITKFTVDTKLPESVIWPTVEKCWQHGRYSRLSGKCYLFNKSSLKIKCCHVLRQNESGWN